MGLNPEKFAKLTPHGVDPGKTGSHSAPEITAQDVAGAMGMAKLSPLQSAILLGKYAGENQSGTIWAHTMLWIGDVHPGWLGEGVIHRIARDAIGRVLGDDRCGQCEGTGEDWTTAPPARCVACRGIGVLPDDHRYSGVWQARYRMLIAMLELAEEEAVRAVKV